MPFTFRSTPTHLFNMVVRKLCTTTLYCLWHECNLKDNMTVWFIVTIWKYFLIMLKYRCKVQHAETKTVFDRLIWKNNILSTWHFLKCSCCINNLIPNNLFPSHLSPGYNIGVICVVILIPKCNCHFFNE